MSNVIDYITDRAHWDRQSLIEVGWLETVELDEAIKIQSEFIKLGYDKISLCKVQKLSFHRQQIYRSFSRQKKSLSSCG